MKREFNILIERDVEGYYVASVPELRGCHTQAKSLDTLMKRVREVIELCLEDDANVPAAGEFVGVQRITVETEGSKVFLRGRVRAWAEREEAEQAAWRAPGVTRVENEITVAL